MIEDNKKGVAYTKNETPETWIYKATKNWMGYLPDNTSLIDISIPGTHDSEARYGGIAAEAKSWIITEQLQAGVRYL